MSRRTWLLASVAAIALAMLGAGWALGAVGSDTHTSEAPPPTDLANSRRISLGTPVTLATSTPDTVEGENQRLRSDFNIELSAPSGVAGLSRAAAIARVRSIRPAESAQAEDVTARLASFTDLGLADASAATLAAQGVRVRPKNQDVWVVTLHHVRIHWHGPLRRDAPPGNVATILDAHTGDFVGSCAYSPVQ